MVGVRVIGGRWDDEPRTWRWITEFTQRLISHDTVDSTLRMSRMLEGGALIVRSSGGKWLDTLSHGQTGMSTSALVHGEAARS